MVLQAGCLPIEEQSFSTSSGRSEIVSFLMGWAFALEGGEAQFQVCTEVGPIFGRVWGGLCGQLACSERHWCIWVPFLIGQGCGCTGSCPGDGEGGGSGEISPCRVGMLIEGGVVLLSDMGLVLPCCACVPGGVWMP